MTETRKIFLSVTWVLIILFFVGCQSNVFQTQWNSLLQDGYINLHIQEYKIQARGGAPYPDSLGIWEFYMGAEATPFYSFYFENGKIKSWGY